MQHEMTIGSGKAASNPELVAKLVLKTGIGLEDMTENYRSDKLAHELFQEMAQDTPRRTAIVCEGRQLSYEELNGRANQLARYLRELGAGPEVLVAICLDRSLDVAISIVATLKAGAAYLPLDPAYPKERLAYMVADAKPRIVITHEHLQAMLPQHEARVVVIDSEWPAISQCSAADLHATARTEDLAYVIYTSGSTGQPKGVMITHGNLGHYVQSVRVPLGLNSADSYLHTASISFSSSVRQLMLPLSLGAKIVIATTEQIRDPLALFELINQQAVTVIDIVPSYWRSCLNSLASLAPAERESLLRNNLRLVLSASEPLPSDVPHEWRFSLGHDARLINMFGQTETAGIVATYPIPRSYEDPATVVPIGRPIPHTQIYLLDSNLQPVPEGVPGEVHIGGPGVGRGYLNQAELTAAKFIPDPFRDTADARLYKTGDLARVGSDGHIQFLGRMDNQVKVRGHRVEPGEIEAALRQLPRVQDALVVARKEDANDPHLIAYVVPERAHSPVISGRARYELPNHMAIVQQNKHDTILTGADLRKHVQQKLPDYLWPSTFIVMESLPRLPNGKVDRQALPAPARERIGSDVDFIPARTSAEESLSKIWSEVLKLDRISVDDNFFNLGGDSILSAQIVARARQAGLRLTPKHLFTYQTIAELALVLQGSQGPQSPQRESTDHNDPDYPRNKCVHELFEDQVKRTPDAVALRHEATVLSYGELNRRANQLAHRLRAMEVGPESLVGIYLERSVEMVVAVLGVLKAGGAYVPLDPAYPQSSISFMIEDAELSVLLTQESLLQTINRPDLKFVCLGGQDDKLAGESSRNLSSETTPENLAYVIYTSGSTGKPKGVMIPHRGLVNYLSWATREYDVAAGCGAPVHSSIAFDLTITSLFTPLLVGQSLHLLSEEGGVDALAHGLIHERNFSLIKITPTHLQALSATLPPTEAAGRTRALVIGGEALTMESLAFWRKHAPATRLINEYGPTETVVGCCVYEVRPEDPSSGATPIGRPIANTRLYVLDERREPVAAGVAGELYIGGDGVARGYLNRPELTVERFIPDPFSAEPGARLYKSGDLARYRADGLIEFLGRLDDQVKIRGYRIELGEIESALVQHENVRECAVVAREDVPGDRRLVGYVVSVNNEALGVTQLRAFLKERLPEYMVPSGFVMLDALPVTINGKVDRKALPPPVGERPDLEAGFAAARTPVEEVMVQIWAEVLKLERVGIYDNFFDLGGDSILGIQILARATKAGLRLKPKQLFQYPTIAGLSAMLPAMNGPNANSAKPEMKSSLPVSGAADSSSAASPPKTGLNQQDIDKVLARINRTSGGRSHAN